MKMKGKLAIFLVFALAFGFAFYGGDGVQAAEYNIRAGIGFDDQSASYAGLQKFKDMVEDKSEGRIEVEIHPGAALGDDIEMMENLQRGVQEVTVPSTAPITGFVEDFAIFDLPFLIPNYETADYILDGVIGQELLEQLEDVGIIGVTYWENGFRQLTNNERPVESVEDMEGLSIRTMENEIHLDAFEEMGASPSPMAFGELFSALEAGVVDGQENAFATINFQHFYEVQQYVTDTGHIYNPLVFMISEEFYNELPSDLQDVVIKSAEEAGIYQRELKRNMHEAAKEDLQDRDDTEVTVLTEEAREGFREAVEPVYENYEEQIGEEFIERVQNRIEEWQDIQDI
ncbi:DctP family TRAP transporter solute-binding subunit [Halarsenatibacter silvermanii]|uniref:Tripartite ATP-independent transporter solute receptor, DctP family n=1 Tax=Halarsenatibacter silvermanii TaxID=321763 RepID=A0A1G9SFJ5_9FIRM|nr:DctP family TRAP transporter solute-binding subunit [Halarsenatibacter silvermanii]SDM34171.1 tripartite ATP-independent transporter solute receptor, DctP family [Halarsenatibacter silvermanii]